MNKIETISPEDWIPYKNNWGHWVWHGPDDIPDLTWPGFKPPSETSIPVWNDDGWHWSE